MAKAQDIEVAPSEPYRQAAARIVRVRAGELFESANGVLDTRDIERVHDMRVASRRLRAVLEIYRPCFDGDAYKPVLRDVKALADALGARRDPDVQLEALGALGAAMPRADLAGIDLLADEVREEQGQGNELLGVALAESGRSDLRGRLLALAEATA